MTIIADGERATALAGVMGGQESEVTDATTDILLEVANFAPRDVRKVRRALRTLDRRELSLRARRRRRRDGARSPRSRRG